MVLKIHFVIVLISGLFLLMQGAPVATSGFSSRAWVNTENGMIIATDLTLDGAWRRMSSFGPRNDVTVAVGALNFILATTTERQTNLTTREFGGYNVLHP